MRTDVLVVGGSAAGIVAGITARRHYAKKKIMVARQEDRVLIPCGIPYIFGTVGSPDKNLIPDKALESNGIDLCVAEVTQIDTGAKKAVTVKDDIDYEKLILATGSIPVVPPIPGVDKDGVFAIYKDVDYLAGLQERLKEAGDVVIIGGGFIGIEFADEIKKSGVQNVTVVEMEERCLSLAYDHEFCIEMEKHLSNRGVKILTGTKVTAIKGKETVGSVTLDGGNELKADVVILGIGARANVNLAREAGLNIAGSGSIAVDRNMKTSDDSVFACGDCAEKFSFFGGNPSPLKLASIATLEARIAGANVYGIKRENIGTVGVWSTRVGDLALATAGMTEASASAAGYEVAVGLVEGPNRHPGSMPGAQKTRMKLLFEKSSGVVLGGQVLGDAGVGEIVNTLSACIQEKMTAEDMALFQTGTHPALTASPIAYPLVNAAEIAIAAMKS
ncbi:MAG: FAD-dependent oxidoreductase [Kiritimatiellia bacterium]